MTLKINADLEKTIEFIFKEIPKNNQILVIDWLYQLAPTLFGNKQTLEDINLYIPPITINSTNVDNKNQTS